MSTRRSALLIGTSLLLAMILISVDAAAQEAPRRRGGLYGDWRVKMVFNERTMESILSFSRDREGTMTGEWISFWGVSELKDVKFEEGQLSFDQVRQGREGETVTTKFKGTIQEGKLTGTLSSEMGEVKVEGERPPRMPRAAGTWAVKFQMGEREINTSLEISADKEGNLAVKWPSERVQHTISDVAYERGRLTFKTKSKMEEREWESSFEGTIEGDALAGVLKSERGEAKIEGQRVGAAVIGNWNLEITGERGARKQRLTIRPDMSALYGALPVEKVTLQDGKLSFKVVMQFGERKFEMSFEGTVEEAKLTGELTSERGSQKVTGTKVPRRMRPQRV